MRSLSVFASCAAAILSLAQAESNLTYPDISKQILPSTFQPPQVFQHNNLVRSINLEKEYARETINVIVQNTDKQSQHEYYLPFEQGLIARVGGLEVKEKSNPDTPFEKPQIVGYDTYSPTEFFLIKLPTPLAPSEKVTLSITYSILSALKPIPASINQADKQYVQFGFSAYSPSAYKTLKQKTKLKLPTTDIPEYTIIGQNDENKEDPQRQGATLTYGPYVEVPAGAHQNAAVRYEFTKPLIHARLVERDVEISHWGGNLATEERYWLENRGASLKNQFSRVAWQQMQYYSPATSALKEFHYPVQIGSMDPYFVDEIGNVSTSRFRPVNNAKEGLLELKPRYPIFGGWKYNFKVGWDSNLKNYLRKLKTGSGYAIKVPFMEGPKHAEGIEYEKFVLRIILPEGATNIKYETTMPLMSSKVDIHRTFMDTLGRTSLTLTALNLVDDHRDRDVVITYDYPWTAGFRKPIVIFTTVLSVFGLAFVVSRLDVSIGKSQKA